MGIISSLKIKIKQNDGLIFCDEKKKASLCTNTKEASKSEISLAGLKIKKLN